jgi:3-hexulose-6-phosphate synthase/6-phospho-3-hexuloisomerase
MEPLPLTLTCFASEINSLHPYIMKPIVQISLDLTDKEEALSTARQAINAGVDWLEAGTPLILAEGMHGIRALRTEFPDTPIVADLKTMDGGWLEAEVMAKAGATHVVVMGQAHEETIECVVKAGKDFNIAVMGDNMAMTDPVDGARRLEDLGCDFIVHHNANDFRNVQKRKGLSPPTPHHRLKEIVDAVQIPVQAVGGLSIEEAIRTPEMGAPVVVIGAPLVIDSDSFHTAAGDLDAVLREICDRVHAYGNIQIKMEDKS